MDHHYTVARLLEAVGVTELEERAYLELLRQSGGSVAAIGRALGVTHRRSGELLSALERHGLASLSATRPPTYVPASPSAALEVMIIRRQEELARTRLAARQLEDEWIKGGRAADSRQLVEVIKGPEAFTQRFHQLLGGAESEVIGFSTPPFVVSAERTLPFKLELLRKGVRVRGVYAPECLDIPGYIDFLERVIAEGEGVRTSRGLPMRFIAVDRRLALIPLDRDGQAAHLLVHASALLDALLTMFEMVWERASPLDLVAAEPTENGNGFAPGGLSPLDRRVLALMATGLRDSSIARKLGIVDRTAQRRVTRLMDVLGAETRFQAGVLAAQHGWVGKNDSR